MTRARPRAPWFFVGGGMPSGVVFASSAAGSPSRGGCSLLCGRARPLEAITARGVDTGDAHVAALSRARHGVPFKGSRSVPLAHIPGVDIRIDVGLCIRRHHPEFHANTFKKFHSKKTRAGDDVGRHRRARAQGDWFGNARAASRRTVTGKPRRRSGNGGHAAEGSAWPGRRRAGYNDAAALVEAICKTARGSVSGLNGKPASVA
jgi:hypothetical protein